MKPFFKKRSPEQRLALLKKKPPKTKLGKRLKDPFGNILLLKSALTSLLGIFSYRRLNVLNNMNVEGMEYLKDLPPNQVLFVSNHQTYFSEAIALYHIFFSAKWGMSDINLPIYLLSPKAKTYYIAAEETMQQSGVLPKILSYAGAVTVKRSWRHKGKNIKRAADIAAPDKVKQALESGWVITFPQGTTTPNAPVRKGAASLIKKLNPIVVPVRVDGFRDAFGKKGLDIAKKGVDLSVRFSAPVQFGEEADLKEILSFLEAHLQEE